MARAFVISYNPHYNVKPAAKFGEITHLFTDVKSLSNNNPQGALEEIIERLDKFGFDPKIDFIVLSATGWNLAMFFAAALLTYGEIKTLSYDAKRNIYYERIVKDPTPEEV